MLWWHESMLWWHQSMLWWHQTMLWCHQSMLPYENYAKTNIGQMVKRHRLFHSSASYNGTLLPLDATSKEHKCQNEKRPSHPYPQNKNLPEEMFQSLKCP